MADPDIIKLDNIDPEDVGDTLLKLEKSFGIKLAANAFKDATTFGDICDIIASQINVDSKDDCTTQQAFYKIRKAVCSTRNIGARAIHLQTTLEDIFPRSSRRKNIKDFEQTLGISLDILSMKAWLFWMLFLCFMLSLIAFFFNSAIAVAGLAFFTLFSRIASKYSKELDISTVRQLTEKISREHYSTVRRHSATVNRNEIVKTIQDIFINDYELDRKYLTKDASLGWT